MVVGNVAAGEITWSDLDEPYPVFDKGITALHVEGTSMEPEIKNGQVVLVRPVPKNADLENTLTKLSFTTAETVYQASRSRGWWLMTRATSSLSLSTRLSGGAFRLPDKSRLA